MAISSSVLSIGGLKENFPSVVNNVLRHFTALHKQDILPSVTYVLTPLMLEKITEVVIEKLYHKFPSLAAFIPNHYPLIYTFYSTISLLTIAQMPPSSLKKVVAIVYLFGKAIQYGLLWEDSRGYFSNHSLPSVLRKRYAPVIVDLLSYMIFNNCSYGFPSSILCATLIGASNFLFLQKRSAFVPYMCLKLLVFSLFLQKDLRIHGIFHKVLSQAKLTNVEWIAPLQKVLMILLPTMIELKTFWLVKQFFPGGKNLAKVIVPCLNLPFSLLMLYERTYIKIPHIVIYLSWGKFLRFTKLFKVLLPFLRGVEDWWNLPATVRQDLQNLRARINTIEGSISRLERLLERQLLQPEQKKEQEDRFLMRLHNNKIEAKT